MTVSSVTILGPFDNFDSSNLRPHVNVAWAGGTGSFDVLYEWDDNTSFTSPLTDTNVGVTSPDEGVPPSDMGGFGTPWYFRVTVTDHADDVDEIQSMYNDATGGDFTVSFDGQGPTAAIPYNETAANLKTALETLSNITTVGVTGAGTSGDPWIVTFTNPGAQDVAMMTANDTGLTGHTVGSTIAEDTAGFTAVGVLAPAGSYRTLSFTNPTVHPRHLYVDHNIGVGFGVDAFDSLPLGDGLATDFPRHLYLNHNIGVGFGIDPFDGLVLGDGDPKLQPRFLYLNSNVDASQPCPWLSTISPTLQATGGTVTLTGDSFGALQSTYTTEIRLHAAQDYGGSYVTMTAVSWSDTQVVVTVPSGATTGYIAVVHTVGATCDGSAFKLLTVETVAANPDMGWWIQTVDKQNNVTAASTILPYNVARASFKKIMNSIGSGSIQIPLSDPDIDAIIDPIMRKGTLIRCYLDNRFRYAFYGEELSHDLDEVGNAVATISGRGMEVVADWTKVLPHDTPASPSLSPTWVYGSTDNFVSNPGFDDTDSILSNPGGEDGNDDEGNVEGWSIFGAADDVVTAVAVQDSLDARTGDWYIQVQGDDNHSGIKQSISCEPNRVYHFQTYIKDETAAGMRVTMAVGGANDITATATYTNNFEFNNEILGELGNVASNGLGTPGGSTDGTWQVIDVEVLTGAEQTSLDLSIQNDHHLTGIFVPFWVDDVTVEGWGLGLSPWTAFDPTNHATSSFRLSSAQTFGASSYSCLIDATSLYAGIQQIFSLNPNTKYTVNARVFQATVAAGDSWKLEVRQNNGAKTLLNDSGDVVPVAGSWQEHPFIFTTPNVTEVEVILRLVYTGSNNPVVAYADSFTCVPGEAASTAGTILLDVMAAMVTAGKLTFVTQNFTATQDSAGNAWPAVLSLDIQPQESLYGLLSRLVALGHEWEIVPDGFLAGGETGFSLNVFTARSFNPDSGVGVNYTNDLNGPVITPGSATIAGRVIKTAFNVNTVFAIDDNGVWSQSQQFPYEDADIPAGDPAPFGYKNSFGIIEEVLSVPAGDATTISEYGGGRLSSEKAKEHTIQVNMQRTSEIRPFLDFGVGASMYVDMPPSSPNPPDATTGLRTNPKRIRAIQATLGGEGADVTFTVDVDRVIYEDELAWMALVAQLAERAPADNTGQGTGTVAAKSSTSTGSGGGGGGVSGSAPIVHTHALTGTEITGKTSTGDVSGTLPGPISVNKIKGIPVNTAIPVSTASAAALVYNYDTKQLELQPVATSESAIRINFLLGGM